MFVIYTFFFFLLFPEVLTMGSASDLSPAKISQIKVLLSLEKYSQRQIAELVCVSQSSVRNIQKKVKENQTLSPHRVGRCGRKKITTPRSERKIERITLENRRSSRRQIQDLLRDSGVNVSSMTLRRRWKEMGFTCRRPVKKPKLTPAMMQKRLAFAREYSD